MIIATVYFQGQKNRVYNYLKDIEEGELIYDNSVGKNGS